MSEGVTTVSLREARKAAGLTQEFVAGELKPPVTVKTLSRWEHEKHLPRNRDWFFSQLAELYGVDVENLNGREAHD